MSKKIITSCFLIVEAILYYFIMTSHGNLLIWTSFISIVLCFIYCCTNFKKADKYIFFALFFTVCADYFLVITSPVNRLAGMILFSVAQTIYAIKLQNESKSTHFLIFRIVLVLIGEIVVFSILKTKTDALSLFSLYYYANLISSIIHSLWNFKKNTLLSIGFILLLLCDTVVGLQIASDGYLPIKETSMLHKILFMDFFLSWFFYLPSQVLISLSSNKK